MKKTLYLVLCLISIITLCSCSKQDTRTSESSAPISSSSDNPLVQTDDDPQPSDETKQPHRNSDFLLKVQSEFNSNGQEELRYTYEYDSYFVLKGCTIYSPLTGKGSSGIYSDYDVNLNPKLLTFDKKTWVKYSYDTNGNMIESQEYNDGELYTLQRRIYDNTGRLKESRFGYFGNTSFTTITTYEYVSDTIYYECDEKGNKRKVICEYDINGNLIKETCENGWTEYQWIAKKQNEITTTYTEGLFDKLDYAKVWAAEYSLNGEPVTLHFAFEKNGNCYYMLGWYNDVIERGVGTYSANNGMLTLDLTIGKQERSYIYSFDSQNNALTVVSSTGIVGEKHDTIYLKVDPDNDIAKVKKVATYVDNCDCDDVCENCIDTPADTSSNEQQLKPPTEGVQTTPPAETPSTEPPTVPPTEATTTPTLSQEEKDKIMLDEAGVLEELRFDTWFPYPEVTLTGYMKDSMTFVPDNKIAIKGYWEDDRWDILDSLGVALHYDLEKGKRYTLKGVLRYSNFQEIEIVEVLD